MKDKVEGNINKDKKMFSSVPQMIRYTILFIVLIFLFVYLGTRNYKNMDISDNEKFDADFSLVGKDNVFKYVIDKEVYLSLNQNNTILFLGTKDNEWVNYYAKLINDVAKEYNIKKILYYDFFEDRKNHTGTYQVIVNKLSDYIETNDEGKKNLYAPTFIVIKKGEIIYFDDETSFVRGNITPAKYWSLEKQEAKKQELRIVFSNYLGDENGE